MCTANVNASLGNIYDMAQPEKSQTKQRGWEH